MYLGPSIGLVWPSFTVLNRNSHCQHSRRKAPIEDAARRDVRRMHQACSKKQLARSSTANTTSRDPNPTHTTEPHPGMIFHKRSRNGSLFSVPFPLAPHFSIHSDFRDITVGNTSCYSTSWTFFIIHLPDAFTISPRAQIGS